MDAPTKSVTTDLVVLLIEDSPVSTEVVRGFLQQPVAAGLMLETVECLQDGLERLTAGGIDLVLLDLNLPDSSGYETFERFHQQAPSTPVIILTGMDDDQVAERAVGAGAQDFIAKDNLTLELLVRSIRYARERSRVAARLEESERHFRAIVEDQTELICRFKPHGDLTFVNPAFCRFFNRSQEDLLTRNYFDLFLEDDRVEIATHLANIGPARPIGLREQAVKICDEVHWLQWTDRALVDRQQRVYGFQSVGRDNTERKTLEEQLRHAQRMEIVGQLVGGIAHDFNNILTAISGYGDLLLHRLEEAGLGGREVAGFEKAVQRAISLTGRLLGFSRTQVVRTEVIEFGDLVRGVSSLLRQLISEQVKLTLRLSQESLWLEADPGMLEQVIVNLVVNARDAMPLGGCLDVSTHHEYLAAGEAARQELSPGDYVVLNVVDEGTGMDQATLARIFEPFFTTKADGRGTGLGLATVARIVAECRGRVKVESALGLGTTFTVFLPMVEEPVEAPAPEVRSDVGRMPRSIGDVLLVEDDDPVRSALELVLQRHGFVVHSCRTAEDALEIIAEIPTPDVLLADLGLPGLGGLDLALQLRRAGLCGQALLISGYAGEARAERARAENFPLLPKPFTSSQLIDKLRRILASEGRSKGDESGVWTLARM